MNLSRDSVPLVAETLHDALKDHDENELVGISCLAQGSDQIFARVVLEHGGTVEVVLPAADYRERKIEPENLPEFDDLMNRAHVVRTLPCEKSDGDAYMAASAEMLDSADSLIAVWDGNPSGGYSGTADVVATARERGIPVTMVWPDGARRDQNVFHSPFWWPRGSPVKQSTTVMLVRDGVPLQCCKRSVP